MDDQATQSTNPQQSSSMAIFGTKIPTTMALAIALLLFFLPFAEIRCNGTAVANNTGLGIAIGSEWKEVVSKNMFGSEVDGGKTSDNNKQDPNKFAIAALALGIIGLLIAILVGNRGGKINAIIAVLGAASLIAMLVDLKSKARSENSVKSSDLGINMGVNVGVEATAAFYFAVILFLLAALFSWQRSKMRN